MRVAAIYDIHGNAPALEAVFQDIAREHVNLIVVGGDVLAGPMPRETLALLLDAGVEFKHTSYNLEEAAELIRATNYPHAEEFALGNVLSKHSEAEVLEIFEPMALDGNEA